MRLPGGKTVRRAAGWVRSRVHGGAVVLLYHRVADEASDPSGLCVRRAHFAEHLDVLRRATVPVRLGELVGTFERGGPASGAVAVTFDDGYADTFRVARPALERAGVPATVFVATGSLGEEYWWDTLRSLAYAEAIPSGAAVPAVAGQPRVLWPGRDDAAGRLRLYRTLHGALRALPPAERREALGAIAASLPGDGPGPDAPRALESDEVARLSEGGLVDIGAHTVTHAPLAALPPERQRDEIAGSKARVEEITGRPAAGFAYPYGLPADYTTATVALVREAGFRFACTARAGLAGRRTDRWQIPRLWVHDWPGEKFERVLRRWMHD